MSELITSKLNVGGQYIVEADRVLKNVTVPNSVLSPMDQGTVKGRLAGSGSGTPVDLTATQARSALGIAGTVLQVIETSAPASNFSTTAGTYVDVTGFSATITPSSTSSKILVVANFVAVVYNEDTIPNTYAGFRLVRGSTTIRQTYTYNSAGGVTFLLFENPTILNTLDSPSTTSPVTYKLTVESDDLIIIGEPFSGRLTLIEVAA